MLNYYSSSENRVKKSSRNRKIGDGVPKSLLN